MPEKDIEAIVTQILESSKPISYGGKHGKVGGRLPDIRRQTPIARPRRRRHPRNPLYTSLRLIILGLVILLVPLLFSAKRAHPPKSTVTGAIDAMAPHQTATVQRVDALSPSGPLTIAPYDA